VTGGRRTAIESFFAWIDLDNSLRPCVERRGVFSSDSSWLPANGVCGSEAGVLLLEGGGRGCCGRASTMVVAESDADGLSDDLDVG
jgi:hypothetical protein